VIDGLEPQGVPYIFGVSGAKIDEVFDVLVPEPREDDADPSP
jgi:thiamine pyrophosphate-dependent acetolactate synthase large subunit-like protein